MTASFDADYFERGVETRRSCYQNYRWLGEPTLNWCRCVAKWVGLHERTTVLDFGCAKGFYVRAFREIGIPAFGSDGSRYAIENCDPTVSDYVARVEDGQIWEDDSFFDCFIAKDVLEHIADLGAILNLLGRSCRRGLVCVPLADEGRFRLDSAKQDSSHVHCLDEEGWEDLLSPCGHVERVAHHIPGIDVRSDPRGIGYFEVTCDLAR